VRQNESGKSRCEREVAVPIGGKVATQHKETCLKGYFTATARASYVKAVDRDGVVFLFGSFFTCVEFAAFVDVFAAGCTFHWERRHKTHGLDFRASLLGTSGTDDLRGVEV
jgi:hypothetical protein